MHMIKVDNIIILAKNGDIIKQWNEGVEYKGNKRFVDPRIKYITLRMAHFCLVNSYPLPVITSLLAPARRNSAHGDGRAVDIRTKSVMEIDGKKVYYWDVEQLTRIENYMVENFFRTDTRGNGRTNRVFYKHWSDINNPNTFHVHISVPYEWKYTPWANQDSFKELR